MSAVVTAGPGRATGPAFRKLAVTEFRLFMREKVALFWVVAFPLLLLVIFGSIPAFKKPDRSLGGMTLLQVYVPVIIALVMTLLALSTLPTFLAGYRERGILRRLATTPAGPARLLGAQLVVHVVVAVVTLVGVLAVARLAYRVALPAQSGGFMVTIVLTVAALFALGLLVAAVAPSGRAANLAGTLLFFPMMFFAGLWVPIAQMPPVLRGISHRTPLGAAVQALQDASTGHWPSAIYLLTLAGYAIVLGAAAVKLFRWE
jgi:ABC-2 type transport system permease protein